MGKQFTLDSVTKLGDHDEKYGTTYWCETRQQLEPVMFNSMDQHIGPGAEITCEEVLLKTSKKNKEYHRLKKVTVMSHGEGEQQKSASPAPSSDELLTLVKDNNRMLKILTGEVEEKPKQDVVHDVGEEPIDLNDIPF